MVELYAEVKAVPFHFRKNVRTLACKVGIPKSTIHDALHGSTSLRVPNKFKFLLAFTDVTELWVLVIFSSGFAVPVMLTSLLALLFLVASNTVTVILKVLNNMADADLILIDAE